MVNRKVLENGIVLLTDRLDYLRSACVGVFVESGASHEPEELCGISHFLEHMLFKGTKTRSAAELAYAFEMIGGQSNAYTSKENTVFYAKALDSHLSQAIELLGDMVCSPAFVKNDVLLERSVIAEEINMYKDSPEDLVADRLFARVWPDSSLGREILGTRNSLQAITSDILREYHRGNYTSDNVVVSIAGSFDQSAAEEMIEKAFSGLERGPKRESPAPACYCRAVTLKKKEIEQNHLCFGFPGLRMADPDRFALAMVSNILGAGMSSRLFLKLREQLGLVYSIYTFLMPHKNGGLLGVYSAQSMENERKAAETVCAEIRALLKNGFTDDEMIRAKESFKTNIVMSFESSYSRMSHMAKGEQLLSETLSAQQMIEAVDRVTKDDMMRVSQSVFKDAEMSVSVLGQPMRRSFYNQLSIS